MILAAWMVSVYVSQGLVTVFSLVPEGDSVCITLSPKSACLSDTQKKRGAKRLLRGTVFVRRTDPFFKTAPLRHQFGSTFFLSGVVDPQ